MKKILTVIVLLFLFVSVYLFVSYEQYKNERAKQINEQNELLDSFEYAEMHKYKMSLLNNEYLFVSGKINKYQYSIKNLHSERDYKINSLNFREKIELNKLRIK